MHEVPHRVVIDVQAASGKLGSQPAYGEIADLELSRQPPRVVARNSLRFMTAHLARLNAAGLIDPLHPADCRADRHLKLLGRALPYIPPSIAATTRLRASIIRLAHPCWPPPSLVNQKQTDLGIPNRFSLTIPL